MAYGNRMHSEGTHSPQLGAAFLFCVGQSQKKQARPHRFRMRPGFAAFRQRALRLLGHVMVDVALAVQLANNVDGDFGAVSRGDDRM